MPQLPAPLFGGQQGGQNIDPSKLYQYALIKKLAESGADTSPVQSPWQGVARLGSAAAGALGSYMMGQRQKEEQGQDAATMAQALRAFKPGWTDPGGSLTPEQVAQAQTGGAMGELPMGAKPSLPGQTTPTGGGMDKMLEVLAGSPRLAPLGLQLGMNQITEAQKQAAALAQEENKWKMRGKYEPGIIGDTERAKNAPLAERDNLMLANQLAMKPKIEGAVAEATAPTQIRVGTTIGASNANAAAQAGLSVAEQKAAAEARGKNSVKPDGFQGTDIKAQAMNVMAAGEAKMANGGKLTPQEQYQYDQAKRLLTQETVIPSPDGNFVAVPAPPLPQYQGVPGAGQGAQTAEPRTPRSLPGVFKRIPDKVNEGMLKDVESLRMAEEALAALNSYPDAVGKKGFVPDFVLQRTDPQGVEARAKISKITAGTIHDLTGAAQSVAEVGRLKPFIPNMTDNSETAAKKLAGFINEYKAILKDRHDTYGVGAGYMPNPVVNRLFPNSVDATAPAGGGWTIKEVR